jgi:hypothetical protein
MIGIVVLTFIVVLALNSYFPPSIPFAYLLPLLQCTIFGVRQHPGLFDPVGVEINVSFQVRGPVALVLGFELLVAILVVQP